MYLTWSNMNRCQTKLSSLLTKLSYHPPNHFNPDSEQICALRWRTDSAGACREEPGIQIISMSLFCCFCTNEYEIIIFLSQMFNVPCSHFRTFCWIEQKTWCCHVRSSFPAGQSDFCFVIRHGQDWKVGNLKILVSRIVWEIPELRYLVLVWSKIIHSGWKRSRLTNWYDMRHFSNDLFLRCLILISFKQKNLVISII